MNWHEAVLGAIHRLSNRHHSRLFGRQELVSEELDQIVTDAGSVGATPEQTLSRILQEMRDDGILHFLGEGKYLLLDTPLPVETEDLPDEAIDLAIENNKLQIGVVDADNIPAVSRRRRGQNRIRELTLQNYKRQCAFCDVSDSQLLVAGHISRWADDPSGRGNLQNTICMCSFHDPLFEFGYFSLSDDYRVLKKINTKSEMIELILDSTNDFRVPIRFAPAPAFLYAHRSRAGLGCD